MDAPSLAFAVATATAALTPTEVRLTRALTRCDAAFELARVDAQEQATLRADTEARLLTALEGAAAAEDSARLWQALALGAAVLGAVAGASTALALAR